MLLRSIWEIGTPLYMNYTQARAIIEVPDTSKNN